MYYKLASDTAKTLLTAALKDVDHCIKRAPDLNIDNVEIIIAAYMKSATDIYIHEQQQNETQ